MKVIVTGSLGNISQPLTKALVQKGHAVTVVSSKPEKQKEIEDLGAQAAIGTLEDVDFLVAAFTGADVVYCMVPPNYFTEPDLLSFYQRIGSNYAQAIRRSGVKRVIHLSSFGAHLPSGTGNILGAHYVEGILNELSGVALTHVRPTFFYYNLYSYVNAIKEQGLIAANYGGEDKVVMVSPVDIAAAIAQEIEAPPVARKVRYVASDERTANEIARVLGTAIGKPDLKWVVITDRQMQRGLEAGGIPAKLAASLVEMYGSLHTGVLAEDYYRNKPLVMGSVKLEDFAKEFAAAFTQK
jgi:uncharacterized protein YbjT (DUF2867 family)